MNDNVKELLILNRMLIFNKLVTDNLVKAEVYVTKIETEMKFIGFRLESLFNALVLSHHDLKKYHKVYCNVFKKYCIFADSILINDTFMNNNKFDYKVIMSLSRDIKDYYEKIKNNSNIDKKSDTNSQYINENEYTLLLSQLEE